MEIRDLVSLRIQRSESLYITWNLLAKKMNKRDAKEYKYKITEEKKGEFKYLLIVVAKEDEVMSYMLVGTVVLVYVKLKVFYKASLVR